MFSPSKSSNIIGAHSIDASASLLSMSFCSIVHKRNFLQTQVIITFADVEQTDEKLNDDASSSGRDIFMTSGKDSI
jgi:hypothetical protein